MITKDDLKEHGLADICEIHEDKLIIKITKGFSGNAQETFYLMKKIDDLTNGKYPFIGRCVTDKDLFDLILTSKKTKHV